MALKLIKVILKRFFRRFTRKNGVVWFCGFPLANTELIKRAECKRAMWAGRMAFKNGYGHQLNPYLSLSNSHKWVSWDCGWFLEKYSDYYYPEK